MKNSEIACSAALATASGDNGEMLSRLREKLTWWLQEAPRRREAYRRLSDEAILLAQVSAWIFVGSTYICIGVLLEWVLAGFRPDKISYLNVVLIIAGIYAVRRYLPRVAPFVKEYLRRMTLLPSILIATVGGGLIVGASWWALAKLLNPTVKSPDPLDITKLAITVAGGIGAVVALVVAYRRQRDVEQGRFVERFGAAAAQLGASQVAVRIAGVYALAGVADESRGSRRQQCVDVLCGYLRLPYFPERGSNYQTKHIRKIKDIGTSDMEVEDHFEYLQNDREVRQTILHVISDRLRRRRSSWSDTEFDFRGAFLEDANLSGATFKRAALFAGTTFLGDTRFDYAKMEGRDVDFERVTFAGDTSFDNATFVNANFSSANFAGRLTMVEAEFYGTSDFSAATFGDVGFTATHFWGLNTTFSTATFEGSTVFEAAHFSGYCRFDRASFRDKTVLDVSFQQGVTFMGADFGSQTVDFTAVQQWGGAHASSFDWSDDRSLKPSNVLPTPWPPEFP
ncbi:pentapeptide repeat-containing protein [Nocardia sp. CA2R105]|uniref:pentapeptide repeat-containing protein n=1 Tax=Nocardia coffeae TaxID=2873381 RepID=UPI001CA72FD7|nr:pentapeptide repeat-containing protein [Nocardia coffeae]MBY8861219.1 pentapeptide repeat-containing protein [Nocardia coffeae]